ncbi:n-acetylglutamate synthase [Telluribacter sp.]|jgi:hypothetical protein|uniref:n-acetylglutamate synthase n=1 Tax=Telluribacter sp. TaxID=1978767 RepID=UPI002E144711|nr:n-acetylglutamate synthase [Telluribacter sp.]
MIHYNQKTFRSSATTDNGDVDARTVFHYHQQGNLVWAEYEGGAIVKGSLLATADERGVLDMRYQHFNSNGELMTGVCRSVPELLPDGRLRLHETWRWTSGDGSAGESVVEEVPPGS